MSQYGSRNCRPGPLGRMYLILHVYSYEHLYILFLRAKLFLKTRFSFCYDFIYFTIAWSSLLSSTSSIENILYLAKLEGHLLQFQKDGMGDKRESCKILKQNCHNWVFPAIFWQTAAKLLKKSVCILKQTINSEWFHDWWNQSIQLKYIPPLSLSLSLLVNINPQGYQIQA